MAIRGVIFDMDGTLTTMCFDFEAIKAEAKVGDADLLDYLGTVHGTERERIHRIILKYEEQAAAKTELNRGARTVLCGIRQRKLPMALLTRNSRRSVDLVRRRLGLEFDVVVSREDGPYKPSPEPIWKIAKHWGLKRHELLMVGDYKWDVLCAANAGIPCAVLLNCDTLPEWAHTARYHVRRLMEIVAILEENQP